MEDKILNIMREQCEEISDYEGDSLIKDGIINSFTILSIVSTVEEELNIEIDPDDVIEENFTSREKIVALFMKAVEKREKKDV